MTPAIIPVPVGDVMLKAIAGGARKAGGGSRKRIAVTWLIDTQRPGS